MFTTGDKPHGCGHASRTVFKGNRVSAAVYLINSGLNLTIMTETTVDSITLEGKGPNTKSIAVRVIQKDGTATEIKARKEIIVSGGAYCSPTILMCSGIGPRDELLSHSISCKVDLPGVGKKYLMDHLVSVRWDLQMTQWPFSMPISE